MRTTTLALIVLAAIASPALAHSGGHGNEAHKPQTPDKAARASIMRLITQSKLSATWSDATLVETRERTKSGVRQTVVTFRKPAERKARQLLHVVLAADGTFVSADHIPG